MNIQSDLDINRAVRRVLVKHWIDLGRVSVRATRGIVSIFGALQRIEGRLDPLNPATVEAMMYEIRRTEGVNQLRVHLENWTNDGGRWRPHEPAAPKDDQRLGPTPGTFTASGAGPGSGE